ncbi:hypothetical protein ISN44_As11g021690 [Arabidopsis suecica]|uniref:Uncharacterized protein n=1 Tax=Arabidopsis suecica TaxID=45249 RepID=A0A8T1ZC22_ARASU|nr:hypothetical protein ISN44_As11g021690 [Arabidopsis suecica]
MKKMMFLVLGAFIISGAILLLIILFLIYVLRELYYDAMGGESISSVYAVENKPLDEEERLISPIISDEYKYPCPELAPADCAIRVGPNPLNKIHLNRTSHVMSSPSLRKKSDLKPKPDRHRDKYKPWIVIEKLGDSLIAIFKNHFYAVDEFHLDQPRDSDSD